MRIDSSNEMKYAPVIIPTLCRYEHFVRCIESLRKNTWAEHTDVYIGLDYPLKEAQWDGYKKIKDYLRTSFPEFHHLYVIEQKQNIGAAKNAALLAETCAIKHDRYIYAEDDLEFSPNFIQYMDLALQKYEDDESVEMVVGYSYPINWKAAKNCTVVKQNFNGSAWGKGVWLKKRMVTQAYLKSNGLIKDFSRAYKEKALEEMIDFAVKDYVTFAGSGWSKTHGFLNSPTDVAMRIDLAVNHKYAIMPLISKVRNHGYDGTGLYCQRIEGDSSNEFCVDNYSFSFQPIDESETFELIEDTAFDMKENRELLNAFDRVSADEMGAIWKNAKKIARLGRYGGAILAANKAIKKAKKAVGIH